MCSVGDTFGNMEIPQFESTLYKCSDCKNEFKGWGKKVICPSCQSKKVAPVDNGQ
jgi:Zn finger protein HypA/HybF involved in hydrogenase expression